MLCLCLFILSSCFSTRIFYSYYNSIFMDIFTSSLKLSKHESQSQGNSLMDALGNLIVRDPKDLVSTFEENLIYGINVSILDRRGRRSHRICYLHEDSNSLLCFLDTETGYPSILDIKNLQFVEENQMLETQYPFLKVQGTSYLHLRQKIERIILLFNSPEQLIDMLSGLRMLRMKLNIYQPYDEEFSQAKKLLALHRDRLSYSDFKNLIRRLNYKDDERSGEIIRLVKKDFSSTSISHEEFMDFLRLSFCTKLVHTLYNLFANQKVPYIHAKPKRIVLQPLLNRQQFSKFLLLFQQQTQIQQFFKRTSLYFGQDKISMYTFGRYIFSNQNSIFNPHQREVYQDMNHPLNSYYCFSSHNTYLTGNQLTSDSKVERYIEDLNRGIKCVEVDVHERGSELIVKHGFTATASIMFVDVITAIADFSNQHQDHWPIILSLEVHLGPEGREQMAEILLDKFGNKIFLIEKGFKHFPPPLRLKNKIIIKTDCKLDPNLSLQQIQQQQQQQPNIPKDNSGLKPLKSKVSRQQFYEKHMKGWLVNEKKVMLAKMTSLYKGSFGLESSYCENVSMDWSKLEDRVKKDPVSVVKYTHKSWLRVYPQGTQFLSSNFNPIPMMQIGAQIIALNTQQKDIYYYILKAHFEQNGCGYLLKPGSLRSGQGLVQQRLIKLQITIISTLNIRNLLNYEQFSYHVKMGLFGSKQDDNSANNVGVVEQVTEQVTDQDATFANSETRHFIITQPEFAFVYFAIDNFGRIAVPVRMMRQGYRAVPLLDNNFEAIGASYILVRVAIR